MDRINVDSWYRQLEDVRRRCTLSSADAAELLGQLYDLMKCGPGAICGPVEPEVTRPELRCLLAAEAYESAALRLVAKCGYMMSRGGDGLVVASDILPASDCEYSFNARSEAMALCGALSSSLQERVIAGSQRDRRSHRGSLN